MEEILKLARVFGADRAYICDPSRVLTVSWAAEKCKEGCPDYGKTLSCPPFAPDFCDTRTKLDSYKKALLFACASMESVSDTALKCREELLRLGYKRAYAYGGGRCRLCAECEKDNCKYPEKMLCSLTGCGIDVFGTLKSLKIDPKKDCFGLVLIN